MLFERERINIRPINMDLYNKYMEQFGGKKYISALLAKRNIIDFKPEYNLNELTNCSKFKDFVQFKELLEKQIKKDKNKIILHTDYDCDGITSSYIFTNFIRDKYKFDIKRITNSREKEGYGLTVDVVKKIYDMGYTFIITADNGISSVDAVNVANELGMTVIITDHHEPKVDEDNNQILPKAACIVDHRKRDVEYHHRTWCGAGTIFFLCLTIDYDLAIKYIDAAGIATVVDMVSLIDSDNRILVKEALNRVNNDTFSTQTYKNFIRTITTGKITENEIGFTIGPIVNAMGRLDMAQTFVNAITNKNAKPEDFTEFIGVNKIRQDMTKEYTKIVQRKIVAENTYKDNFIILEEDIPEGIVGLIAGKISEKYLKPTIIFTGKEETLHGSGRASNYNLQELFVPNFPIKISGGGHKAACGVGLEKKDFNNFKELMKNIELEPLSINIDGIVNENNLSIEMLEELNILGPFGIDNPKPLFQIKPNIREIKILKEEHICASFDNQIKCMLFFFKDHIPNTEILSEYEWICELSVNEWNNKKSLQLITSKLIF